MSDDGVNAETIDDAMLNPFVRKLMREMESRLKRHSRDLAMAATTDPEIKLRALGGRIAELGEIFRLIQTWRET